MFRIVLVVLLLASTSLFSQDNKNTPQPIASDPLNAASRLLPQGQFDVAIQKYQQIIADNPKSSAAYAGLTRVYLKQENVRLADETITKALTRPATWKVPNDYASVRQMQNTATPLALGDTPIARLVKQMATAICGSRATQPKKKGFRLFG